MLSRLLFAFGPGGLLAGFAYAAARLMGIPSDHSIWSALPIFIFFGGLGWSATTPRPERGEGIAARKQGGA